MMMTSTFYLKLSLVKATSCFCWIPRREVTLTSTLYLNLYLNFILKLELVEAPSSILLGPQEGDDAHIYFILKLS